MESQKLDDTDLEFLISVIMIRTRWAWVTRFDRWVQSFLSSFSSINPFWGRNDRLVHLFIIHFHAILLSPQTSCWVVRPLHPSFSSSQLFYLFFPFSGSIHERATRGRSHHLQHQFVSLCDELTRISKEKLEYVSIMLTSYIHFMKQSNKCITKMTIYTILEAIYTEKCEISEKENCNYWSTTIQSFG